MRIASVSFGKIFDINYRKSSGYSKEELEERVDEDTEKALMQMTSIDSNVEEVRNIHTSDTKVHPKGIRIFTGDSFKEYQFLEDISEVAANQYADKEAVKLLINA